MTDRAATSPLRPTGAVLVAGALALSVWLWLADDDTPTPPAPAAPVVVTSEQPPTATTASAAAREAALPDEIGEEIDPVGVRNGTGTLIVRGLHVDGWLPAAGLNLELLGAGEAHTTGGFMRPGNGGWLHGSDLVDESLFYPAPEADRASSSERSSRADADGIATFLAVPAGDYDLLADRGDSKGSVRVEPGRTTRVDFLVQRGFRFKGRVVDESGRALAGVELMLQDRVIAQTDANGYFHALDLSARHRLRARFPNHLMRTTPIDPAKHIDKPAHVVLSSRITTALGNVTTGSGDPVPGVTLTFQTAEGKVPTIRVETDQNGQFQQRVHVGPVHWFAKKRGMETASGTRMAELGRPLRIDVALQAVEAPDGGPAMSPWSGDTSRDRSATSRRARNR